MIKYVRMKDGTIINTEMIVCIEPMGKHRQREARVHLLNYPQYYCLGVDADELQNIISVLEKQGML